MNRPECSDCSKPACCYEKDSSPRRWYCGRHGSKWARTGLHIIQWQQAGTDDRIEPWSHTTEPLPEERLASIVAALGDDPRATSRGHKRTLRACRRLADEVIRLRAEPGIRLSLDDARAVLDYVRRYPAAPYEVTHARVLRALEVDVARAEAEACEAQQRELRQTAELHANTANRAAGAERERVAALLRGRAAFSAGALADALEDVAVGVLNGETDSARVLRDPPPAEVARRSTERRLRLAGIRAAVLEWCHGAVDDPEVRAERAADPLGHVRPGWAYAYAVFQRRYPAVNAEIGELACDEWGADVQLDDIDAAIRGVRWHQ